MLELFKAKIFKLLKIADQTKVTSQLDVPKPVDVSKTDVPQRIQWTPELVERFWDGISKTRLVELNFSKTGGHSFITAIDHLLTPKSQILDFGAGDGDLVKLMCERGLKIAAYEPSGNREKILKQQLKHFPDFLGMVGANSKKTFDVVIMSDVIEHIVEERLDITLNRVGSLTRLGGILIVTTPNNEDLDLQVSYCPISNTVFHRWQHVRSFTHQSLVSLLSKYGFEEIVTHQLTFDRDLFVKYDRFWGSQENIQSPPSHITEIRNNRPVQINGMGQPHLLYIGRRK